jgi:predicted nucleic acid-binding protein
VILIDSSAWIEYLRNTGSAACERVDELLDSEFALCEPVRMEILAGARDERHLEDLRRLLAMATLYFTEPSDYESAANLYRQCRQMGATPRKLIDCLIAAIAIRNDLTLLHADVDFDVIAKHAELQVVS